MINDIEFQKDTDLLTEFLYIEAGLNASFIKTADMGDEIISFLRNVAGSIVQNVKEAYEKDGWHAVATYVIQGLLPFKLKFINSAFESLTGVGLSSILEPAFKWVDSIIGIKGKLEQSDADKILSKFASGSPSTLYQIKKQGEMVEFVKSIKKEAGFFDILKKAPSSKKSSLASFLVKWLLKLIFAGVLGAASIEGAKAVTEHVFGPKENEVGGKSLNYNLPPEKSIPFKSSSWGETYFINSNENLWFVPLVGTLENTVYQWIIKIYPELKEKNQEVIKSNSFNKMVSILGKLFDSRNPSEIQIIPNSGLHSLKDIVDRSVGDLV